MNSTKGRQSSEIGALFGLLEISTLLKSLTLWVWDELVLSSMSPGNPSFHWPYKFSDRWGFRGCVIAKLAKLLRYAPDLPKSSWPEICDPPFEEEILAFIRKLGYSRDIKSLSDVKVDTLHQPWRTSEPSSTNVLMVKEFGLRTKTYYDFATGKVIPKPKYVRRSTREKTTNKPPKDSPKQNTILPQLSLPSVQVQIKELCYTPGFPDYIYICSEMSQKTESPMPRKDDRRSKQSKDDDDTADDDQDEAKKT
ncbi:hypothetical protein Tco_0843590 [Tanacetum coccineum]|uniref:Uncharacterized protein n=1 Tax=Tanacetum coccineum TaxID=301880 RepID=A0ABQ5B3Q6_9ASTR